MELKMFDRNPREMNRPDAATLDERYAYHCAAEYRDRGWSVIPLCGKKPLLPSWRAFQQRTSTLGEIAVWFGGPVSDMPGVGIVTGGCSGLVVIDCDAPEDAEYWLTNFAPSPLMVRTGGGGMHVYYRMPESDTIGNRTRLFGRKIDVRGEGGYVCAPPSRHENGTLYQWVSWGDYCLENVPSWIPRGYVQHRRRSQTRRAWFRVARFAMLPPTFARSARFLGRTVTTRRIEPLVSCVTSDFRPKRRWRS